MKEINLRGAARIKIGNIEIDIKTSGSRCCPKCEAIVAPDALFCSQCGISLKADEPKP